MEWNEIERKWRDKQNNMEVKPSNQSWDLLSEKLDNHKLKRGISSYLKWFSVAACLLLGGYMLHVLTSSSLQDDSLKFDDPSFQDTSPKVVSHEKDVKIEEVTEENSKKEAYVKTTSEVISRKMKRVAIAEVGERDKGGGDQLTLITENKEADEGKLAIIDVLISKKTDIKTVAIKVDSNLLLDQVDEELEMEYRDTKVKKIYETAKRAIVDISNSKYEK